jgi:toxin CcdB
MAQYDVFTNPSRSGAEGIPYVVVIQSDLLDALATRLTIPLAELDLAIKAPTALCPVITVRGKRLHALAHYAAPLPERALRRPVGSVAAQASVLVAAMDVVLSGI